MRMWYDMKCLFALTGIVNIWLNYLVNAFYCINDNKKQQNLLEHKNTLRSHFTHSIIFFVCAKRVCVELQNYDFDKRTEQNKHT